MSEMISVASGFQYSVNIGYDLNNDAKLKNFIPTQSALQLLSDVLDSTAVTSTERSRIVDCSEHFKRTADSKTPHLLPRAQKRRLFLYIPFAES